MTYVIYDKQGVEYPVIFPKGLSSCDLVAGPGLAIVSTGSAVYGHDGVLIGWVSDNEGREALDDALLLEALEACDM